VWTEFIWCQHRDQGRAPVNTEMDPTDSTQDRELPDWFSTYTSDSSDKTESIYGMISRWKPKYSDNNLPQCHCPPQVPHRLPSHWTRTPKNPAFYRPSYSTAVSILGLNSGPHYESSASHCLSYETSTPTSIMPQSQQSYFRVIIGPLIWKSLTQDFFGISWAAQPCQSTRVGSHAGQG
jgi:hypothetical protein